MKTYNVEIVEARNGGKTIAIEGLVLSAELKLIKEKLGDISKYSVGKKIKVKC
jgi:hypothetical protein